MVSTGWTKSMPCHPYSLSPPPLLSGRWKTGVMSGLMNLKTIMGARGRCGFEVVEVVEADIGG